MGKDASYITPEVKSVLNRLNDLKRRQLLAAQVAENTQLVLKIMEEINDLEEWKRQKSKDIRLHCI